MTSALKSNLFHQNGDLVSTAFRFSDRNDFKAAVRKECDARNLKWPIFLINWRWSYSFPSPAGDSNPTQETLIVRLRGNTTPTQPHSGPSAVTIPYCYSDAPTRASFDQIVDNQCSPGSGRVKIEDSYHSPGGSLDGDGTYRAVVQVEAGLAVSYKGWMTNPPYPAKRNNKQRGELKWLLPAVLGLATGLAVIPVIRVLRHRFKD